MTSEFPALALILVFPALGFLFNVFLGRRMGRAFVNIVGPGVLFAAFAVACVAFANVVVGPSGTILHTSLWNWFVAGPFHVDFDLQLDALSAVMVIVVTGVGSLIHLYSVGYMAHDEDFARYFAYLNLFALAMLILILANNMLLMFMGWEGVGLCSYLLISFWYTNPQYAYNGRKAFIVNRIGDAGFVLGMLTVVAALGTQGVWTLEFPALREHASALGPMATIAGLLFFLGATGKSAQVPLYVWLPDAMVGPTPVSALIHAATMVTAGIYMVARLSFLYRLGPDAMNVVATIGTLTAFFAATVALVQADIKRVLAYSTVSQLGYMFMGVGVGAFSAGIFHVMTHAFFKGLLFLCAGSVIHALDGEQDMNRMGALKSKLPITYITMLIATLAITAIPPFSGFFSKDLILEAAYSSGHMTLWLFGVLTAGLTAFYMFRLIFMTFHGESRVEPERLHHAHESPPVMTIPLIVLAILSVVGGWVGLPDGIAWGDAFARFLAPVVGEFKGTIEASPAFLSGVAATATAVGIVLAYLFYLRMPGLPHLLAWKAKGMYDLLLNKYYVDEFYNLTVTRPLFWVASSALNRVVDTFAIEGVVNGAGLTVETSGELARRSETGNVQQYAFVYVLGVVAIVTYYVYLVTR